MNNGAPASGGAFDSLSKGTRFQRRFEMCRINSSESMFFNK